MSLDKKLLVCEAMLARLDSAMASAEAEIVQSSALEDYLRRLLDNLKAEQARLDRSIRSAVRAQDNGPAPDASAQAHALEHLCEQMTRIRAVQKRLLLVLQAADRAAQHP